MMTITTPELSKGRPADLRPTHGKAVCAWIQKYLVHGEGDKFGQPFRLEPFQKEFIYRLYEYDEVSGLRVTRRALLGLPKGNGKTELMAAIGLAELAGPTACQSPNIPVAAASYEQANLLFGTAATMLREGPLGQFFEIYGDRILINDRPGRMYRVAAEAGTNDGTRPTCFIADEVHEWTGSKERVHLVISNSLQKRLGSLSLNISTAGFDTETLLGQLYKYGKKVESGEIIDPTFLFKWYEASMDWDLTTEDGLIGAIRECNPAADKFWPAENLVHRYHEIQSKNEFERYHLNRWTNSMEAWIPRSSWEKAKRPGRIIPNGAEVCLGFDGSFNGDSTALVAATPEHVVVVDCWERPDDAPESWQVPILDVEQAIRDACKRWNVTEIACDPYRWARTFQILEDENLPIVEFPQSPMRMVPATQRFYDAIMQGDLTHPDDKRLNRHVGNAMLKVDSRGARLAKENKKSTKYIDLAVASVMAYERACQEPERFPAPMIF